MGVGARPENLAAERTGGSCGGRAAAERGRAAICGCPHDELEGFADARIRPGTYCCLPCRDASVVCGIPEGAISLAFR